MQHWSPHRTASAGRLVTVLVPQPQTAVPATPALLLCCRQVHRVALPCRPAIRLVCKAWNQALVAGGLWHTFCLESPAPLLSKGQAGSAAATAAAAWLAGKLALLQQTAPHVQALVVRNSSGTIQALAGGTQLERCLAVPQLAGLRSLTLGIRPRLSQRLLSSILRFQQLIELHILSGGRLPANTFAVVAGFPFLRSLHVSSSQLEEPLLAVILQRTALTALSLGASRRPLLAWAVQHLPALPGLRAVSIAESSSELHEQAVVQQWLKAFPRLATFEYACSRREGGLKVGAAEHGVCETMQQLGARSPAACFEPRPTICALRHSAHPPCRSCPAATGSRPASLRLATQQPHMHQPRLWSWEPSA